MHLFVSQSLWLGHVSSRALDKIWVITARNVYSHSCVLFQREQLQYGICQYICYCDLVILIVTKFITSSYIYILIIYQCWIGFGTAGLQLQVLILFGWLVIALLISPAVFACLEGCPRSLTTVWLNVILYPEQEVSKLLLHISDSDVSSTS